MRVTGKTQTELFRDALAGMVKIMSPEPSSEKQIIKQHIALEAPDTTALLIDFLSEALSRMQSEREVYTRAQFHTLNARALRAELEGYKTESFGEDIKAVTYHEAEVRQSETGEWSTTIIFDI